jgi:ferredoxin-type protein NapG
MASIMTKDAGPSDPKRRRALKEMAMYAAGTTAVAAGICGFAAQTRTLPAETLRPPGALPESKFQSACVRCGLCVRACPYDTLRLAEWGDGPAIGTPYFIARDVPCEMCDDIPCVKACPTGALDHGLTDIENARMGEASLVGRDACLNMLGLRCDVCYRVCPVIDKAITLQITHNARTKKHAIFEPVVHRDACTGCGKCEKSCVLETAAIRVLPLALARGEGGAHYRLGWEEKKKAGGELVPGVIDLPDRVPGAAPGDVAPPSLSKIPGLGKSGAGQ